ncbi:hypothetical protein VPNG_01699 [Cytospora leucostoma]|uniref:HIG1 domain-containing protein n=1 Tax=Cytospora leucostoma TaxID=1230097 RepID=A0A423XLD6_9PEZI|nr:hypothetical protein VPNG_01699 [Cytospora leucostoma]
MDQVRNNVNRGAARQLTARNPRIALFALTAAGVGLGIRYRATSLEKNEAAQRSSSHPNYYVSVDRSGGGI